MSHLHGVSVAETVLITGAGSGIGKSLAVEIAARGHQLILADVDARSLDALCAELDNAVIDSWCVDGRDARAVADCFNRLELVRHPSVLVNGIGGDTRAIKVDDINAVQAEDAYRNNVIPAINFTHCALPAMRERRFGRLVFMASVAGRTYSRYSNAAYVAAKAGLVGYMKQCAFELASSGITANAVAFGPVDTTRILESWAIKDETEQRRLLMNIPVGRHGTVEEAVHALLPFCLGESGFITGAVLDVSGGLVI